ncbi:DUF262 domain-containing protein [Pseudoduganella sp. FT26W]|uniref:DUF262 domain-containing protein n=1 Tax=Duganella aquatilis TaxID=2666082 RepID=A0A844D6A3_9BURK|nr:DUF262 domain-containing protein [Duganella aquatilis]MRW83040.1 DUF262 domain-containing protein [Duganella aquatilis]
MKNDPRDTAEEIDESEEFSRDEELDLEQASDEEVESQIGGQPFRVVYQTNNFLLPQIRDLIVDGDDVNLRPEYQRRLRWTNIQKSLLIESLLLNVPVPPVFFYENDLARYEVMDGQQRLNAIKEFLNNSFKLRGLQIIPTLNGRTYTQLPAKVKRGLDRASISAIVLLQESKSRIKKSGSSKYYELRRFVFERLNTGGKRLSAQEIRNAIYAGHFNELIVRLSRDPVFTRIWGIPPYTSADPSEYYEEEIRQKNTLYRTMGDCQLVLRFFALDDESHIQGSMKAMLDRCMERNVECTREEADEMMERYLSRLYLADELFDGRPFSLAPAKRGTVYRPVAGVYDGVMAALDEFWHSRDLFVAQKGEIKAAYGELIRSNSSTGLLTGSANTAADIRNRIGIFRKFFGEFV